MPARGCVTALDGRGAGCAAACEFLGGLTVLHAAPAWHLLAAVAAGCERAGTAQSAVALTDRLLICAPYTTTPQCLAPAAMCMLDSAGL